MHIMVVNSLMLTLFALGVRNASITQYNTSVVEVSPSQC